MATTNGQPSGAGKLRPLQVNDDMRFQRRTWAVERVGWAVMALLVLAALLGLFSIGPLSTATAQDAAGRLTLQYQRFQRYSAPSTLRVTLPNPPGEADETVSLRIGRSLIEAVEIERVQPEPQQTSTSAEGLTLAFRLSNPATPGIAVITIRPETIGPVHAEIGLAGQEQVRFTLFVYP